MNLAEIKTKHQAQKFLQDAALHCVDQRIGLYEDGIARYKQLETQLQQEWDAWFEAGQMLNRLGKDIFARAGHAGDEESGEIGDCSAETRAMLAQEFFEARRERRQ